MEAFYIFSSPMVWNDEKDVLLCREMLVVEPYQFKEKTRERGQAWTKISDNINLIPGFSTNMRAIRERFKLLETRYKKKNSAELKATGISPEISELDTLLEEIISRMKDVSFEDGNKKKEQDEKRLGEDIRLQALETFAETRSRKPEDDTKPCKKRQRTSGSETVSFLRERMANEEAIRERELKLKKMKLENQKTLQESVNQNQNNMMAMMNNSMQQLQQITAGFMQAQSAQTQALYSLLEKNSK